MDDVVVAIRAMVDVVLSLLSLFLSLFVFVIIVITLVPSQELPNNSFWMFLGRLQGYDNDTSDSNENKRDNKDSKVDNFHSF